MFLWAHNVYKQIRRIYPLLPNKNQGDLIISGHLIAYFPTCLSGSVTGGYSSLSHGLSLCLFMRVRV